MPGPVERAARAHGEGAEDAVAKGKAAIRRVERVGGLAVDEGRGGQWKRRNTRVPLVPPNPNELETATSIFISRAVFGT